jgi:hypothetical protein
MWREGADNASSATSAPLNYGDFVAPHQEILGRRPKDFLFWEVPEVAERERRILG